MSTVELHNSELLFVTLFFVVLQSDRKTLPYSKGIFLHAFYIALKAYGIHVAF